MERMERLFSYFIECVVCEESVDLSFADEKSLEIFAYLESLRRDGFLCEKCRTEILAAGEAAKEK